MKTNSTKKKIRELKNILNHLALLALYFRHPLQLLQAPHIGQHDAREAPHLLGRILQRTRWFALEEIHVGQEVVRTATTLQARDQLQENAIDAIRNAILLPFHFPGMLLALVEQQRFQMIRRYGITGQIQVTITQRLQYAKAATATGTCKGMGKKVKVLFLLSQYKLYISSYRSIV